MAVKQTTGRWHAASLADVKNDPQILAKLLRAIANGADAKANKHDVIFAAAAGLLERSAALETAVRRYVDSFAPGMVVTIGGNEIGHADMNEARRKLQALLSGQ